MMERESPLQNLDIVGILVTERGEIEHQAGQKRLTRTLRRGGKPARAPEGNLRLRPVRLHGGGKAQHIIHGGLYQTNGAGNGRTHDIRAGRSITAVPLGVKTGEPVSLHMERDGGHTQAVILPIVTLVYG